MEPARGGTRGGKDQFDWNDVKGDKDREYYLGHSVKASVGRWQKGKDILWYTREKGDGPGGANDEIAAIKAAEENAMAEALGLKPRTEHVNRGTNLEKHEMDEFLKRGRTDDDRDWKDEDAKEAARIKGLGAPAEMQRGGVEGEVLGGVGLDDDDDDDERRVKRARGGRGIDSPAADVDGEGAKEAEGEGEEARAQGGEESGEEGEKEGEEGSEEGEEEGESDARGTVAVLLLLLLLLLDVTRGEVPRVSVSFRKQTSIEFSRPPRPPRDSSRRRLAQTALDLLQRPSFQFRHERVREDEVTQAHPRETRERAASASERVRKA